MSMKGSFVIEKAKPPLLSFYRGSEGMCTHYFQFLNFPSCFLYFLSSCSLCEKVFLPSQSLYCTVCKQLLVWMLFGCTHTKISNEQEKVSNQAKKVSSRESQREAENDGGMRRWGAVDNWLEKCNRKSFSRQTCSLEKCTEREEVKRSVWRERMKQTLFPSYHILSLCLKKWITSNFFLYPKMNLQIFKWFLVSHLAKSF